MSNPGSKGVLRPPRNKTPLNQSGRSSIYTDSVSNSTEDVSAGNKLYSNSARRTPGKSSVSPSPVSHKRPSSSLPAGSTLRPENQFTMKKRRYLLLRKELMDKQKAAQDLYNDMSQLREKLISNGARDPGKPEDLRLEVGSPKQIPPTPEISQVEEAELYIERLPAGIELLETLEDQLREIPRKSQDFSRDLLDKQSNFVAFVTSHLINASEGKSETDEGSSEVIRQLEIHQKDYDGFGLRLHEIEVMEDNMIGEFAKYMRRLIDEYEHSRAKLKAVNAAEAQKELQAQLNETLEELQAEKEKNNQSRERLRQMETQLQKSRTKTKELEARAANDEGKIQQLQVNMKNMDGQMKQKDMTMEVRMKDMHKTMKNSEVLVNKVEKQRDSFEARLMELKEKMTNKENEAMATIKELSEKLNAITGEIGMETVKRQHAEEALAEFEERYKNLEEKSTRLCELAEKNKDFTITEGNHTENEVQLFNELRATREELEMQKQMMEKLEQEKEEIVAVMHQAASREEDEDSREKLAAKLVLKNNKLQNLMMQYQELKKVAKNAQERNGNLEKQLMEIQTRVHSQSMEGGKAGLSAHAIELQQQVSDLRNNLAEVIQQKENLETVLTQKQLELEQRDRVMREQNKFLKAKDELLYVIKGKVQEENGEQSNSDENNEYLEEAQKKFQDFYATLMNKQLQIFRLEQMVQLMEDHQDCAQAQRTRLEARIAELELSLQKKKEQRYTSRQTSSDDDPPYICERCRQQTSIEENEERQLNKNDSSDNINESFHNWLTNLSSLEVTKDSGNTRDFQDNDSFCDSDSTVRNRKYASVMYKLHRKYDNEDDSSRESQSSCQRKYHRHRYLHHRIRSPIPNRI
ncbi:PREDICTED: myosin-11-like, partial [Habropoda laboriosa]|uniref:myosin-11-like n=1 Tax=Habropoda laboriosa TaxID=597456 RepID=UPI00083D6CC9